MSRYSDAVLADSPSLYWRLGEPSGTNANDETANNRDGTYVGTPTLAAAGALYGDSDTAVDLNGTSQRITSGYNPFTNATTRTFEGWAWRDTSSSIDALFGGNVASNRPVLQLSSGNQNVVFFSTSSAGGQTWTAAWPGNAQWVHWVLVFNESTDVAELFINGASQGTKSQVNAYNATPGNISVGAYFGSDHFDGKMDEFAVYESALSAAQILNHYKLGKGLLPLVADSVSMSDAPAKAPGPHFAETPAVADSAMRAVGLAKADTPTLSDAVVKAPTLRPSDVLAVADATGKAPHPTIADSTTLLDAVQDAIALALVDATALADSRDPTAIFQRSTADSVGLADDSHRGPGLNPAENLALLDALVRAAGIHFADAATPADALATGHGVAKLISDTVALSDAVREALALALAELVAVSDATTHAATLARTLADSTTLADALVRRATLAFVESIAVAEAQAKRVQLGRADTAALDDALARLVGTTLALADAVALADATRRRNRNESSPWFVGPIDMEPIHLDSEIDLVR